MKYARHKSAASANWILERLHFWLFFILRIRRMYISAFVLRCTLTNKVRYNEIFDIHSTTMQEKLPIFSICRNLKSSAGVHVCIYWKNLQSAHLWFTSFSDKPNLVPLELNPTKLRTIGRISSSPCGYMWKPEAPAFSLFRSKSVLWVISRKHSQST
jgi:hypothetical protein